MGGLLFVLAPKFGMCRSDNSTMATKSIVADEKALVDESAILEGVEEALTILHDPCFALGDFDNIRDTGCK